MISRGAKVLFSFGLFLILSANAEGRILFHQMSGEGTWIYSIDEDGKNLHRVAEGIYPQFSNSGTLFAHLGPYREGKEGKPVWAVQISDLRGQAIAAVPPMTGESQPRPAHDLPCFYAWSPDDRQLVIATTLEHKIYVRLFDLTTGQTRELFRSRVDDTDVAMLWSSLSWLDSRRVLFTHGSPRGREERLVFLSADGRLPAPPELRVVSEQTCLYKVEDGYLGMTPAPDKTEFALYTEAFELKDLFLLEGRYTPAAVPRRGRFLLYRPEAGGEPELFLLDLSTRKQTRLTPGERRLILSPLLSPAGDEFLALYARFSRDEEEYGLLVYDLASGQWSPLHRFHQESGGFQAQILLPSRRDYSWH